MATYKAIIKTNHFRVTDEEKLKDIASRIHCDGMFHLIEDSPNGDTYSIEACGNLMGVYPDKNYVGDICGPDFGLLTEELQTIIPEGEALILFELGTESFRYLVATATVITRNEVKQLNLLDDACNAARKMLNDPAWETQLESW